MSAVQLE
jgi:hypothetical protein